ncbi:MAG: hypothetical protein JW709_01670 [Sedimentisphaerales bacterium]|nr:hypothetical protein [Sedimentisphaerales bacterium]
MVFCGIDIGSTNAKGILLDQKGDILSRISIPNPSPTKKVFWYDYFAFIMNHFSLQDISNHNSIYCSITSQGGSFVLVDDRFQPVSPMYLWTEAHPGQPYADTYMKEHNQDEFYRLTGWQVRGWLPIFKLKGIDKGSFRKVALVPDFIYAQMTGKLMTDITNAQMTGFCNFENKCWSSPLMLWAGVDAARLPEICDATQTVFPNVRTAWGSLNLVTSSHDQYAAMNAVGLESDKDIMLASGTAWVINSRRSRPVYDMETNKLHPGRDVATKYYGNISVIGRLGEGFHDFLCRLGVNYTQLAAMEDEMLSMVLPDKAFGASEYDTQPSKPVAIKGYMKWMAEVVRNDLDRYGFIDGLEHIVLTGGAAISRVLPQVLADVCGIGVKAIVFPELTAYGAAKHAAQAAGVKFEKQLEDIAKTRKFLPATRRAI